MNIDSTSPTQVTTLPNNGSPRPQADPASAPETASPAKASSASSDVSLSPLSTNLLALGSASSDDIDLTRVNAVRTALANGTFQSSASGIADGLLKSASSLLKSS